MFIFFSLFYFIFFFFHYFFGFFNLLYFLLLPMVIFVCRVSGVSGMTMQEGCLLVDSKWEGRWINFTKC